MFQSTHPRRVWLLWGEGIKRTYKFQSTHPRRVWLWKTKQTARTQSFNPHTHAGCDKYITVYLGDKEVSIHTPTQGVTMLFQRSGRVYGFQSTHPRRVWLIERWRVRRTLCFNPHTHAGCDHCLRANELIRWCFNPHTHAGCDTVQRRLLCKDSVSIHTPTQGVTRRRKRNVGRYCFNPHTHAGCDYRSLKIWGRKKVSIHTPTQGVTVAPNYAGVLMEFQSTHPRRVWPLNRCTIGERGGFNPHTHAGCDTPNLPLSVIRKVSIHTPTQGVT